MRLQINRPSRTAVLLGATACLTLASPALAQDGMRYLSWSGKPAVAATPTPTQLQPVSTGRYPSIASAGGRPSRYSPSVASGGLTPANAWYAPSNALPPPAYATPPQPLPNGGPAPRPQQPYAPQGFAPQPQGRQPVAVPQTAMSAAPVYVQPNYAAQPMPGPHYQQQQQQLQQSQGSPGPAWAQPGYSPQLYTPQGPAPANPQTAQAQPQFQGQPQFQAPSQPQPVPVQQAYTPATVTGPGWASPQPVSAGVPVADPMAPRRDAPIFSIQGAQPQMQAPPPTQPQGQPQSQAQTASADGPARSGPRYYSVHRAAGHEPDPTAMPESVYAVIPEGAFLDAARTDLADPPPPPIQTRTINGRVQAINQGADPSLP